MPRSCPSSLICLVAWIILLGASAPGQFVPISGDIATVGRSMNLIQVMGGACTASLTSTPSVGAEIYAILWDPNAPDSFIVAGRNATSGYLSRVRLLPGGPAVTPIVATSGSTLFSNPVQISWDQSLTDVIVADAGTDQVYRVAIATGTTTAITTGTQPWSGVTSGAIDPLTGDVFVGTQSGNLYRVPNGGVATSPVVAGLGAPVEKVLFDPLNPVNVICVLGDRIIRIDRVTGVTTNYFVGAVTGMKTADLDQNGDFVIGTQFHVIHRMPNVAAIPAGGLTPTLCGSVPGFFGGNFDISVVGGTLLPFSLIATSYTGSGGGRIDVANVPAEVAAPGYAGQTWIFVSSTTFLPIGAGPVFGLVPDQLFLDFVTLTVTPIPTFFFHSLGAPPAVFNISLGTMNPFIGQTWDVVMVAWDGGGNYIGKTNISRVTW